MVTSGGAMGRRREGKSNTSTSSRISLGDDGDEVILRLSLRDLRDRKQYYEDGENNSRLSNNQSEDNSSIGVSASASSVTSARKNLSCTPVRQRPSLQDAIATVTRGRSKTPRQRIIGSLAQSFSFSGGSRERQDASLTPPDSRSPLVEEATTRKLITEDLWSDDAEIVERGLKKLSGILGHKKTSDQAARIRTVIFRAGGHLAIVQAMKKHRRDEDVQGEGCRALGICAEDGIDSGNENEIASVGGIDAILAAMGGFRGDEQIQDFGCGALQNLTTSEGNARLVLEKDGLTVVLTAMKTFPHSIVIQESACWTIANLCRKADNRLRIERGKSLGTVATAIDNHPRCEEVKIAAQEAVEALLKLVGAKASE